MFVGTINVKGGNVVPKYGGERYWLGVLLLFGFTGGGRGVIMGRIRRRILRALASLRIPPFVNVFQFHE